MAPTKNGTAEKGKGKDTVYSTTGTVSAPVNLDELVPKGEHTAVNLNGSTKNIRPKPKVTLTSLTPNNSGTLRRINSVVIPIVYSDKFYKDVLDASYDDINKLVYYGDIPVGSICCRIESIKSVPTLTILTLAILAPYRSLSLGTALILSALKNALHPITPPPPAPSEGKTNTRASLTVTPRKPVKRAVAHVQVGNERAKRFYERLGFRETEIVKDYYTKIEPKDALLMVCEDISSALGGEATQNGTA